MKNKVIKKLEQMVAEEGTQVAVAEKIGVTPAYISDVLSGRREPGKTICDALGFERIVAYVPTGEVRAWWDVLAGKLPERG